MDDVIRAGAADEWRRGWPVVLGALVGIGTGPGLFQNMSSLFTPGLIEEFGWTRGEIATAAGSGLVGALAVPMLGRVADRWGIRPVIVGCMLLLGAAYLCFAALGGELWHYRLLVFCLAFGVPGTSSVVYGRLIAGCFHTQRGLALGVATSGLSLTTLLLPPAVGTMIAWQGWRGGFVALAVFATLLALPVVLLALRGRMNPPVAASPRPADGATARTARRDGRFWRLGLTAFFINLGTTGFITQLVPFGIDRGLSPGDAALLLAAFGASQLSARLAIGALVDRLPPQRTAAAVALLSALAFVALQIDGAGFAALMVLVFVAGLMNGAEYDLLPFLTARLFGLRAYGEVYGSLIVLALAGTAAGVIGFGRLHDATGGDAVALGIAAAALAVAALLFLSLAEATRTAPR